MKIIKTFLLVTLGLFAATLLHAQEIKTEMLKPTAIKAPPTDIANNRPSPAPELKPMNGITLKQSPVAASPTPSPFNKDENKKQAGPTNNLTAEQLNTLNGIAEKPKQTAPASTLDAQQNLKPAIVLAPAVPLIIKNEKQ